MTLPTPDHYKSRSQPQGAFNRTPDRRGSVPNGKEPALSTRCSRCDAFPSWEVSRGVRLCETCKKET